MSIFLELNERELELIDKGLDCLICNRDVQNLSNKIKQKIKELETDTHKCSYMECNLGVCKNVREECYELESWMDESRFNCFSAKEDD